MAGEIPGVAVPSVRPSPPLVPEMVSLGTYQYKAV